MDLHSNIFFKLNHFLNLPFSFLKKHNYIISWTHLFHRQRTWSMNIFSFLYFNVNFFLNVVSEFLWNTFWYFVDVDIYTRYRTLVLFLGKGSWKCHVARINLNFFQIATDQHGWFYISFKKIRFKTNTDVFAFQIYKNHNIDFCRYHKNC